MLKKMAILIVFIFTFIPVQQVQADNIKNNNDVKNEYAIIIEDDANLLNTSEEKKLINQMQVLTKFGYVMLKTTSTKNTTSSLDYIKNYYYSKLGNKSGVAFYIDMNKRQVCACATGGLDKIITNGKCDTIMDNVYKYAKKGDYYECSRQTFLQMNKLLNGEKIAESMKYICNAIIAIMLSLFACYGFYILIIVNKKATNNELIEECEISLEHSEISVEKTGTHSEYSPVSDSSSSGGGFSGGGRRSAEEDSLEVGEVTAFKSKNLTRT